MDYKARHNNVTKILHKKLALKYSILNESTSYCKHNPSKVLENNLACLYWDKGIPIDKLVLHYCPDITLFEKSNKIFHLTDVSQKYAELSIEVKKHWQVEAVYTLTVTIAATGVIPHTVVKWLDLPDFLYMTIKRSVILNTCNIESS